MRALLGAKLILILKMNSSKLMKISESIKKWLKILIMIFKLMYAFAFQLNKKHTSPAFLKRKTAIKYKLTNYYLFF